jgi:hypothetical protein
MNELPFSPAAERNQGPILEVIRRLFQAGQVVLEIGSGTGQHALHFASATPGVVWIPTETGDALAGLRARLERFPNSGVQNPLSLDVTIRPWPVRRVDHVFSANTAHIMSWQGVCAMFAGVAETMEEGFFVLYGPFNRDGTYTSEGNRSFDRSLRARDPEMGIRDDRELVDLGRQWGLELNTDIAMPTNNRLLVWRRTGSSGNGDIQGN